MGSLLSKKTLKQPQSDETAPKKSSPVLKWLGRFFMGLGVMMFVSLILSMISLYSLFNGTDNNAPLPHKFALAHSFGKPMPNFTNQSSIIAQLFPDKSSDSLHDFMIALNHAKQDDRVTHFVAKIKEGEYSLTQIATLRDAIIDFRQSGKKTYAYLDTMGGLSNNIAEYWLATAFDDIWMQPVGSLAITGISIEQPFIKSTLDKIGITMEMEQRKEFKTGPETYTRTNMSSQNRITIQNIGSTMMEIIIDDIAQYRAISPIRVRKIINQSPLTLAESLNLKLIDKIAYIDELETVIKTDQDDDFIFSTISSYNHDTQTTLSSSPSIAVIQIDGMILDEDPYASLSINKPMALGLPDKIATADIISSAINTAAKNDDIKVILLDINSPGGSPSASETIRRAVIQAKSKGKYIIAHMGDVAASGGYWIATHADEIIASDLTITGSIGVYGGKPDLSQLWDKIGVNWDSVQFGDNAGIWSTNKAYSQSEKKRLSVMMDEIYKQFIERVADGRDMDIITVEKVAKGRAWTGKSAKERNLIDHTGGLQVALNKAKDVIQANSWDQLNMMILPHHNDPLAELMKSLNLPIGIQSIDIPMSLAPIIWPQTTTLTPYMTIKY